MFFSPPSHCGSVCMKRPSKFISNKLNTGNQLNICGPFCMVYISYSCTFLAKSRQRDVPFKYVCCSTWYTVISTSLMDLVLQQHVGTSISHNNTNRGPEGGRVSSICLFVCFCACVSCVCMLNFGLHLTRVCPHVVMYQYNHGRSPRISSLDLVSH